MSESNKVLLVEDDSFFASLVSETLSDVGFDVVICQTVQDVLKEVKEQEFILFIVDAMLPNSPEESGISMEETRGGFQAGKALLRRLRNKYPETPAMLLTAYPNTEIQSWCKEMSCGYFIKPIDRMAFLDAIREQTGRNINVRAPSCFIVHGHDHSLLSELRDFIIDDLKFSEPILLKDVRTAGKTVIESLESYGNHVDVVFVLLTPDDKFCNPADSEEIKRQARQNVIFELGLFYGYLGRLSGRVILMHKGPIDIPSDISGIIYIDITDGIEPVEKRIRAELSFWLN